ncbi:MAG: PspC domain-containing protein [Acidimicrobiales bacterium]
MTRTHDGLTGVGGGIAEYAGIDPVWVRVGILAGSLVTFPLLPIVYVGAWLIIPKKDIASPPPPRPSPARTAGETHDAAVAMALARAEVDAIDRVQRSGPMAR